MCFSRGCSLPNPDGAIRTGMEGRGKVSVGWYPAGYVLFRRPVVWLYSRLDVVRMVKMRRVKFMKKLLLLRFLGAADSCRWVRRHEIGNYRRCSCRSLCCAGELAESSQSGRLHYGFRPAYRGASGGRDGSARRHRCQHLGRRRHARESGHGSRAARRPPVVRKPGGRSCQDSQHRSRSKELASGSRSHASRLCACAKIVGSEADLGRTACNTQSSRRNRTSGISAECANS